MNKLLTNATKVGGFPLVLDDLRWPFGQLTAPNQQGIYQAFNNLLRGFGDNFIVQGCVEGGSPGAITLTEGWILLAGELLKVDAQAAFDETTDNTFIKVTTFDSRGNKTFQNGAIEDVYEINRGNISGSGGTLAYNGLRREQLSGAITDDGTTISTVKIVKKIIEIGDWDMVASVNLIVTHGITDFTKIRSVNVIIKNDALDQLWVLDRGSPSDGSILQIAATFIALTRAAAGFFDGTDFDSTSFNRGWITIEYEL